MMVIVLLLVDSLYWPFSLHIYLCCFLIVSQHFLRATVLLPFVFENFLSLEDDESILREQAVLLCLFFVSTCLFFRGDND